MANNKPLSRLIEKARKFNINKYLIIKLAFTSVLPRSIFVIESPSCVIRSLQKKPLPSYKQHVWMDINKTILTNWLWKGDLSQQVCSSHSWRGPLVLDEWRLPWTGFSWPSTRLLLCRDIGILGRMCQYL